MSALVDLVEPLKRAVALPGATNFTAAFPNTTDDDLRDKLLDAFAEAQLYGFFPGGAYAVTDLGEVTPDLTRAEGALVVIFASTSILETEIRNRKTHVRYEAKGVVSETDQSAQMLVQLLKDYSARKAEVLARLRRVGASSAFYMIDQYFARATEYYPGFSAMPYGA